ncbi:MAG: outer membrane lipoprotein-sorting protein [bacterium]
MRYLVPILSLLFLLCAASPARADAKGDALLQKVEFKTNDFKGLKLKWTLTVKHKNRKHSKVKFNVITRPGGQRLVFMTYPGDIKGMTVLVQSKEEMYVYLPAFRKVRRIAGHVRNTGFQGSGFTYDDMAISRWRAWYSATLIQETATHYLLDLRLKPGKIAAYARLQIRVLKDIMHMDEMRFINKRGKKFKTQYFKQYVCRGGDKANHCNPRTVGMIEHTRGNLVSEMRMQGKIRYTGSLSDRIFTVRHLLRSAN